MKPQAMFGRIPRLVLCFGVLTVMASRIALAGQGAGRMLYTVPNSSFVMQRSNEVVAAINDVSGSIATLQTSINNARATNPTNVIVIRLQKGTTYIVSNASLTLGFKQCLVAEGATLKAANNSIAVPLVTIAVGATNVSIAGGSFDGNGANVQGIYAPSAARLNIDKVTVKNCGQDCILLKGQGNSTYDNEMSVTRCDVSGSPAHAGISIQNSTQTIVAENNCHDNLAGIWLSCAWATVVNNTCHENTTGIDIAGGNDNVISNNTCDHNGTGIHAGGSNNMITSNSTGNNSSAGVQSDGSSNTFVDNLFTTGNAVNLLSSGSGNRVVAYKGPSIAAGQTYFYPPLFDDQHSNPTIVNGMGRTDVTVSSTTIAAVQSQYNAACVANPTNAIVLHLNGTFTVGSSPLYLSNNTCVLLNGTIQVNSSTTASTAVRGDSLSRVSISGGTIDGGGGTGRSAIYITSSSMVQVDRMALQNFGPSNPRSGGSDVIHFSGGSTPYIVTRCYVNGGSARGIWLQLNGPKSVISDNEVTSVNQDGVDCDSSTKGCIAKFNYCHDLVRYGVFIEQSASYNMAFGNICNNNGRDINLYNNYATYRAPTAYNTVAFNWCYGNNGIRNGSTGTNTTVTSHNFIFNNTVVSASITSELEGSQNYYSQNYHVGTLTTSGTEVFFNPTRVSTNQFLQDDNSGLATLVQNAATTNGAAIVIGAPSGLTNDLWSLIPTDSGYYQIANQKSGKVMAVQGASLTPGAAVIQWTFGAAKNDQWMPISAGNGLYYFLNRLSGLCLEVAGGATLPGLPLDQQHYSAGANQQFALTLDAPIVQAPFFVAASPLTQTVARGTTTNYVVTLTTNAGFVGPVSFSMSGLSTNATVSFTPASVNSSGSSTATVSVASSALSGSYTLTISASTAAATNTVNVGLVIAAPGSNLIWNATSSSAWDTTTMNWYDESSQSPSLFQNGKNVVFTDRTSVLSAVTLASGVSVAPASIVVNAATNNYAISGSGKITGTAGLLKTGASTLTITSTNDFTGKTLVQDGVLSINAEATLGTNPVTFAADQLTLDGGTLQAVASFTIDDANRGITVTDNGGTFDVATNVTLTIAKTITGGVLNKSNNGTLALNVANTYTGGSFADAGSLRANILGAYGYGPVTISGTGVAYLNVSGTHTNDFNLAGIGPVEATGQFGAIRFANNNATATTLTGTITLADNARISARGIAYSNPGAVIAGPITGSAALEFGNSGNTSSPGRITLQNSANDWSGDTTISHGTLRLGTSEVIPNGADAGNVLLNNSNPTNDSVLDLNGFSETINGLYSSGADLTRCLLTNSSAAAATIILGDGDASGDFGGNIRNGAGSVAVTKIGVGTQILSGNNSYTGPTIISNGTLLVHGALANGAVTAETGATLGGDGTISGPVLINPGATLAMGPTVATLNVNNSVTLRGVTVMKLDAANHTNDVVTATGPISYGGTLLLTNVSGTLAAGGSFKLFNASSYAGSFTNFVPAIPGLNLAWNTNNLGAGILGVVAAATPPPRFSSIQANINTLTLNGSNGVPNYPYFIVASTNISLPLSNWTVIATNVFDTNGRFSFTNLTATNVSQQFYQIQLR